MRKNSDGGGKPKGSGGTKQTRNQRRHDTYKNKDGKADLIASLRAQGKTLTEYEAEQAQRRPRHRHAQPLPSIIG